jgi:hypothetical protein
LFKFFSKSTTYIAPAVIAPRLRSRPATHSPLDTPESAGLAAEVDTLSVFLPEDNSSMSARARARVAENVQAAARYATAVDVRDARVASQIDAKRLDDFHKLFRQTQVAVDQLRAEATAIRNDLRELRSLGDHLGQGYARLGDICRLTEKRSDLTVDVLDAIDKRIEPLEIVRNLSTTESRFASLKQLAEEMMQYGARFETQKEAIDRAREEATRVARLMDELQPRVALLTEKREWLEEAEATVGRLEGRAAASMDQLARRIDTFDAEKSTIERAAAEATRVTAVLSALDARVAALTGSDRAVGQAETAISQLEPPTVQGRARVEPPVRSQSDAKYQLERVRKRLQTLTESISVRKHLQTLTESVSVRKRLQALTESVSVRKHLQALTESVSVRKRLQALTESARNSVNVLRSAGTSRSAAWKIEISRPHLRWAAILALLVSVNLLGIAMLLAPDQPGRIAGNARAAVQESRAPVPLPSTWSHFAMFDMPAGLAAVTMGTNGARQKWSPDGRDGAPSAPAAQAAGVSQAGRSKEPVQFVGALTVESEPAGSVVFVDRQLVGETPLELPELRAGSHVVRIERDGFDRWTTAVLVTADKQTRVSARLQAVREP